MRATTSLLELKTNANATASLTEVKNLVILQVHGLGTLENPSGLVVQRQMLPAAGKREQ